MSYICHCIYLMGINGIEPDEIYQDTLITVFEKVENGGFEYRGVSLLAYAKSVVRNKTLTERRRKIRAARLAAKLLSLPRTSQVCRDTETAFERLVKHKCFLAAVARLAPRPAEILGRRSRGWSYTQIAQAMDMSEGAVRKAQSRTVKALEQFLS